MTNGVIDSNQKIVTNGLVLHLDAAQRRSYSGSGTVWTDLSGNGNNGTLTNGPTFNSANGGSIQFDGSNDHVNMGDILNNVFAGTNPKYSFNVWVMFNTLAVNTNYSIFNKNGDGSFAENQRLLAFLVRNVTASSYNGFQVEIITFFDINTANYRGVRTLNANLKTNTLYNIQLTFDSTVNTNDGLDRVKIYINGQLQSTTISFSVGTLTNTFQNSTARLALGAAIGTNPTNIPNNLLNGTIYNASIYNRALSDAEVLQNYNATKARFEVPALLDLYPNAAAAYSLRKLRSGYTGSAIRVRRSSDNTEQDIGFTSTGDLDTTALTTFVGANNGFVTTWYDQSGTNNNFIQTGNTNQPLIINTGSLILDKNKPIISFDGVNQFLVGGINTSQQGTIFAIFNPLNDGAFRISQADPNSITSSFSTDTLYASPSTTNVRFLELLTPNNIVLGNTNINNSKILTVYNSNSVVWSAWVNSNSQNFTVTSGVNTGSWFGDYPYPMYLQRLNRSSPFNNKANIQEIIIYNTNQSTNRIGIETNINSYYGIYNSNIDTDAQAFITAASITDSTQQGAVDALVKDLKNYGIWTKMKAIYPFVGGTANAHKFNLKDPRDVDGAFRLVFNGGWTHSSTGALPNGSNGFANTNLTPSTVLTYPSAHISVYSRTNTVKNAQIIGVSNSFLPIIGLLLKSSDSMSKLIFDAYDFTAHRVQVDNINSTGYYIGTLISTTSQKLFKNSNLIINNSIAQTQTSFPSFPFYLSGRNDSGTTSTYDDKEIAFATIGDGLTDTEAANLYTAVQKYQTTLGRQV